MEWRKNQGRNGKQLSVFGEVILPIQRENINVVTGHFVIADHWLSQDILIGPSLLGQLGFSLQDNLKARHTNLRHFHVNPTHPKKADPPNVVILQRPLTENKQQKTKAPAPKQDNKKISTTPSPHSRHESSESKFCASCSYKETYRSTPVCNNSRPWLCSPKLVPLSRIKSTYKNYPHARHKGPIIYAM